jgi:hypothetical protein
MDVVPARHAMAFRDRWAGACSRAKRWRWSCAVCEGQAANAVAVVAD